MKMQNKSEQGRSMIEMLGVLAIIGVLTAGGFSLVTKVSNTHKVNVAISELTDLARKARVIARDYSGAVGDMTSYLQKRKAYPDDMEYNKTQTKFIGSDDVEFKVYYNGDDSNILYVIEAANVNMEMCMQMAVGNYGSRATTGFVGLAVGQADVTTAIAAIGSGSRGTMGLGDAATNCKEENGNVLHFGFR